MFNPEDIALVRAMLGPLCASDEVSLAYLGEARAAGGDPTAYLARRFGLAEADLMQRAADWADLAYSPVVPQTPEGPTALPHLDHLGKCRALEIDLYGRRVIFVAPDFDTLVQLAGLQHKAGQARQRYCLVPMGAITDFLTRHMSPHLMANARDWLGARWPYASARRDLTGLVRAGFVLILWLLVALAFVAPFVLTPLLLPLVAVLMLGPSAMRFGAVLALARRPARPEPRQLSDAELPPYTVLVPLHEEANMVPQLARALKALDYPAEKLDIKFIVESESPTTLAAVRAVLNYPPFSLIEVPAGQPRTKPKALDFALPLARGRYAVVFDAEDIPEPDQLRRAASRFDADPGLDCIQAELVVENHSENLLTRLFAAEYAGQFGVMLPALADWRLPVPLGGTSNHFRVRALREAGAWDAFNVTEDADLGVRLARLRYRVETLSSRTYEEAPIGLRNWMHQRTRWMKGWMQTFTVHNMAPRRFLTDMGWRRFLAFEIYVGGMIASAPLHLTYTATLIWQALNGHFAPALPPLLTLTEIAILALGYLSSALIAFAGLMRLGRPRDALIQLLLPVYWLLMSWAAVRASLELLVRPFFWAKTNHGRTRVPRGTNPPR